MLAAAIATAAAMPITAQGQANDSTAIGKVKVGGRLTADGAFYLKEPSCILGNGTSFTELRVKAESWLSRRTSFKAEIDFAGGNVVPRDVFIRHQIDDRVSITFGNQCEMFSPAGFTSIPESAFTSFSTTAQAFACGRNLGLAARYVTPKLFLDAGIFSQDLLNKVRGSKGYAFTSRAVYRPINDGVNVVHLGISNTIRRADANGITKDNNGNEVEQRIVRFGSKFETNVDKTCAIEAANANARFHDKVSAEMVIVTRRIAVQGEYIRAFVKATSPFVDQHYYGYYGQVVCQLKGKGLVYSSKDALHTKSEVGSIDVGLRYSMTDLDDSRGYLINGSYYNAPTDKQPNGSINGGIAKGMAATISFTPRKYLALAMEYCYGKVVGVATPTGHYHIAQAQAMIFF